MSFSVGAIPEEPSPSARRDTDPGFPFPHDLEAQQGTCRKNRPQGQRRATTSSTFASSTFEPKSVLKRRDTLLSNESTLTSPTLGKVQTWRVEDEALFGYPKLATLVGGTEGYAIYKRFGALNARNLLYHQAKLVHLEHELNELEESCKDEHAVLHYKAPNVFEAEHGTPAYELRNKHEQVSRALDKYNRLLLDQRKMHELPSPDSMFVESIWNFINSKKAPHPDWLEHPENTVYAVDFDTREPIQKDLVTLNPAFRTQDMFTRFFTGTFLDWWHSLYSRFKKPDGELDEYVYQEKTMSKYMSAIVMIVASALPTCSIVALYFIESPLWRLAFIIIFGGVFSSALAFFTDAKRVEVFTACVALASVQVVFVGTAFGNGSGSGNGNAVPNG